MNPGPSSYDFFSSFHVKITILVLYPLVMARGPDFYWRQVGCCYMEERGRTGLLSCTLHALCISLTCQYTPECGIVAREAGRASTRKKWQTYGYPALLLTAFPPLCKGSQLHLQEYARLRMSSVLG